jgi:hypothetical protein
VFPDTQSVTVVGSFTGPDGLPMSGFVYYLPTEDRVLSGSPGAAIRCEGRMELSETGEVRGKWLNPHAAGVSPSGWNYRVIEAFHGCETSRYTVSIPGDASPTVDLDINLLPRVVETA